jgi:predicted DNA-binding transcriptional regulator YafY
MCAVATQAVLDVLTEAIVSSRLVRLGYSRKADGVVSLHHVAPVDIRRGDTAATEDTWYLWAYCVEEARLERHLVDRIVSATGDDQSFDPRDVLRRWPEGWPLPDEWVIPRQWTL